MDEISIDLHHLDQTRGNSDRAKPLLLLDFISVKKKKTKPGEHHRIGSKGWQASNKVLIHSRSSFNVYPRECNPIDQFYHQNSRHDGRRLSSNRGQRDEQEMIPHRHPPRARIPTPVREANVLSGGGPLIGNIGIPRAAQRFRGSASFEEEARERPISSPAFQQCGFICVTISQVEGGGGDWPSKGIQGGHVYVIRGHGTDARDSTNRRWRIRLNRKRSLHEIRAAAFLFSFWRRKKINK